MKLKPYAALLGAQDREQRRREEDRKDETFHFGRNGSLESHLSPDKPHTSPWTRSCPIRLSAPG